MKIQTIADLNRFAAEYYARENVEFYRRLADPLLREIAFERVRHDTISQLPVRWHSTIEGALKTAEQIRIRVMRNQAQLGRRARKSNRLNDLIGKFVSEASGSDSSPGLLKFLKNEVGGGLIEDVDDEAIYFIDHNGRSKKASISGLKHRLTRIHKKMKRPQSH